MTRKVRVHSCSRSSGAYVVTTPAWVQPETPIEVLGPTFIVHPSEPPACVAYDSTRDRLTFPSLPTTEPITSLTPTDVSHVWVITRIAGSPTVNLRTATGKFMSCDAHGLVSADREARGPQEEWTPVVLPDLEPPMMAFLNSYDKYLGIDEVAGGAMALRGDADEVGFNERFFVRVQNEYKQKATEEERKKNLAADLERGGKIDEVGTKCVLPSALSSKGVLMSPTVPNFKIGVRDDLLSRKRISVK